MRLGCRRYLRGLSLDRWRLWRRRIDRSLWWCVHWCWRLRRRCWLRWWRVHWCFRPCIRDCRLRLTWRRGCCVWSRWRWQRPILPYRCLCSCLEGRCTAFWTEGHTRLYLEVAVATILLRRCQRASTAGAERITRLVGCITVWTTQLTRLRDRSGSRWRRWWCNLRDNDARRWYICWRLLWRWYIDRSLLWWRRPPLLNLR